MPSQPDQSEIQIFSSDNGEISVQLIKDTVWLSQRQLSDLLETSTDNISLHFRNIYKEGELSQETTTEDFSVVQQEGSGR